jgi:hypothetical protein
MSWRFPVAHAPAPCSIAHSRQPPDLPARNGNCRRPNMGLQPRVAVCFPRQVETQAERAGCQFTRLCGATPPASRGARSSRCQTGQEALLPFPIAVPPHVVSPGTPDRIRVAPMASTPSIRATSRARHRRRSQIDGSGPA